jgi:hypothetical protein
VWHVAELVVFAEDDTAQKTKKIPFSKAWQQTKSNCIVIDMWLVVILYNTSNNMFLVSIGPSALPSYRS